MKSKRPPRQEGALATAPITGAYNEAPVDLVLERLDHVRRSGRGWQGRCPSHEDRSPSLSIAEGRDGRVLLHDHAGCSTEEIVRALGLNLGDLFPRDEIAPHRRPQGRRDSRGPQRLPRSVAEKLAHSKSFPRDWEVGKLLAERSAPDAKLDVLAAWDGLSEKCDIPAALAIANVVRGVAMFRYLDGKSVQDPLARRRAVRRLVEQVSRNG